MEVKGRKRKAGKLSADVKQRENGKPPAKKNKIQKEKKSINHDNQLQHGSTLNKSGKKLKKKPKQLCINEKKDKDFVTEKPKVIEEDTVDVNSEVQLKTNRKKDSSPYKLDNIHFNEEQLKERIENISSKEELSKTARRKLAVFKKKLQILQGTYVKPPPPTSSGLTKTESRKLRRKKKMNILKNEDNEKDVTEKSFHVAKTVKGLKVKSNKCFNDERFNKKNENVQNKTKKLKSEKIKEESDENIENDESDENDEESDENNEESEEDNEESDEDNEESDEDENEVTQKNQFKQNKHQLNKTNPPRSLDKNNVKKKIRYVLFVGNIPFTATADDIKKHFLAKVSDVTSVRIPLNQATQKPRGIAYVEFNNSIDYEKGLSLHHSQISGRRINVLYTQSGSKTVGKRSDVVAKNKKLHALRKKGKLAGSVKETQKRSVRRNKQKNTNA